jgi:diacylglycerol kinase (ATP)
MNLNILKIMMSDYDQHHYDKEKLKSSAQHMGAIEVNPVSDLEQVRLIVNKFSEDQPDGPKLSPDWCFIDCKCLYIL